MRWERLFADIEGQGDDDALVDRDALAADLRDEQWALTPWRSLLGGTVDVDVRGAGRLSGEVRLVNEVLVHLRTASSDQLIAVAAVLSVHGARQRAASPDAVAARTGWTRLLRAARDDGDVLRVVRVDGQAWEAVVDVVGEDFVRLQVGGRGVVVPFGALAAVTFRR